MSRILIVDDEPANLKLFSFLLRKAGFEVEATDKSSCVLPLMRIHLPDLVLMDVQLPELSGLDLTRLAKSDPALQHIPIIAVSAYAHEGDAARAIQAGCIAYLTKPIDAATFAQQVAAYVPGQKCEHQGSPAHPNRSAEIVELRKSFLRESIAAANLLLASREPLRNVAEFPRTLHRWAGAGSTAGCPEVSELARMAEGVLRGDNPGRQSGDDALLRDLVEQLRSRFEAAQTSIEVPN